MAEDNGEQREEEQDWHELLRRVAAAEAEPASPPVHNTFTHVNTTTSTATVTAPPTGTVIAVFTAADAVFTVTEVSGQAAVDGKSLTPGGPAQMIGGEYVSENSKGNIIANGQTLSLAAISSSSQAATQPAAPSSAGASSSSGAAGGQGGSSSSSGGAGPMQTAAANVVAIVGAVVGAMVL